MYSIFMLKTSEIIYLMLLSIHPFTPIHCVSSDNYEFLPISSVYISIDSIV